MTEPASRGDGAAAQRVLARYLFAHTPVHRIDASTEANDLAHGKMHDTLKTVAGRAQWLAANKIAGTAGRLRG